MSEARKMALYVAGMTLVGITVPLWGGAVLWSMAWMMDFVTHWNWPQH